LTETTETPAPNMVSADRLRSLIERIERIREDRAALGDDEKLVYAEAKADGYTPKYMRAVIKLRQKPPSEQEEDEAMMEMYMAALGMAREAPLFRHVAGMGVDVAVRERVIEALKLLAPQDGEITIKVGAGPRVRLWRDKTGVQVEDVPDVPVQAARHAAPPPAAGHSRPGADAPDCTADEAFALGRSARREDLPVIANPFAWDDKRRRAWDEGWRAEDGGDGMGPK
jgi:uncharacterized protein (UPF0335 family)